VQKAAMRKALAEMGKAGKAYVYNSDYLHSDSMGEADAYPPKPADEGALWDAGAGVVRLKDGTRSRFRALQPSEARVQDLSVPWGLEAADAEVEQATLELERMTGAKARFDALPSRKAYFEPKLANYRSIFQQTEDEIAAEHHVRVQGAIETWQSKVVVDDPTMHVNMRSRDYAPQSDRQKGALDGKPVKKSVRALYRGKNKLTNGNDRPDEPSIFMHESTADGIMAFENSLRAVDKAQWTTTKKFNSATDFEAGGRWGNSYYETRPTGNKLKATWEYKRSHAPLTDAEKTSFSASR